jgi:DNA polymerase III alpha subunit
MVKKLQNRFIDDVGRVVFSTPALCDFIKNGKSIGVLLAEENDDTIKYNRLKNEDKLILYTDEVANVSIEDFDDLATSNWKTPTKYQITDEELIYWLFEKCSSDIEYDRVKEELNMYEERNLYPLLKHLIYLVDHFRKNGILWGVGRGSSVSSFCLYLIGIHKVNSLLYDLDIHEFLK